jgi:hypothetical protein
LANPPAIANSRVARTETQEVAAGCADSVRCRIGLVCLPTETYAFGSRQTAHMLNVDIAVLIKAADIVYCRRLPFRFIEIDLAVSVELQSDASGLGFVHGVHVYLPPTLARRNEPHAKLTYDRLPIFHW